MVGFWEKVKKTLKESAEILKEKAISVAEKTQEATEIGKLKIQIIGLNRDAEKNFAEMGGRVYELIEKGATDVLSDAKLRKLIDKAKQYEEKIANAEKKLKSLSKTESAKKVKRGAKGCKK
ncbi:MAG TPA: hypothetical protein EYP60_05445 [bacterium (Candidatus Stahlbacteria)]|nr:hypothetical protein [Candidatus Stahlbacteria bacterium]